MLRTLHRNDHDHLAEALGNLGQYYANSGDRERGVVLKREALEMLRRLHGESNIDVADARARGVDWLVSDSTARSRPRLERRGFVVGGRTTPFTRPT